MKTTEKQAGHKERYPYIIFAPEHFKALGGIVFIYVSNHYSTHLCTVNKSAIVLLTLHH